MIQDRKDRADKGTQSSRSKESGPVSRERGNLDSRFDMCIAFERLSEQDGVLHRSKGHLPIGLIAHFLVQDLCVRYNTVLPVVSPFVEHADAGAS